MAFVCLQMSKITLAAKIYKVKNGDRPVDSIEFKNYRVNMKNIWKLIQIVVYKKIFFVTKYVLFTPVC